MIAVRPGGWGRGQLVQLEDVRDDVDWARDQGRENWCALVPSNPAWAVIGEFVNVNVYTLSRCPENTVLPAPAEYRARLSTNRKLVIERIEGPRRTISHRLLSVEISFRLLVVNWSMIKSLDEIPVYIEDEVRSRIAAKGNESTLIVDESKEEFILAYTGFTKALKREYNNACKERGENAVKVYHLTKDSSGVQLVRYKSVKGMNEEEIWREAV